MCVCIYPLLTCAFTVTFYELLVVCVPWTKRETRSMHLTIRNIGCTIQVKDNHVWLMLETHNHVSFMCG